MNNFGTDSSIHGVKFIFASNQSKYVRILWIFLLLTSTCCFFYYINLAYTKWRLYPEISIKITEKPMKDFPMPAITICPMIFGRDNVTNYESLRKLSNQKITQKLSLKQCEYLTANLNWCNFYGMKSYLDYFCKDYFDKLDKINILEMVNKSSYQHDELFELHSSLKWIFTSTGSCFTYNIQDYKAIFKEKVIHDDFKCFKNLGFPKVEWNVEKGYFEENSTFPESALKILKYFYTNMNPLNVDNYCTSKSVYIYLHLPNEMPSFFHKTLVLNYGHQASYHVSRYC